MTPPFPAEVEETVARRNLYRYSAHQALAAGEYLKAAELTWGAVTQEWIRAAFFLKNQATGHFHAQFRDLCGEIAILTGDRYFVDEYHRLRARRGRGDGAVRTPDCGPPFAGRSALRPKAAIPTDVGTLQHPVWAPARDVWTGRGR